MSDIENFAYEQKYLRVLPKKGAIPSSAQKALFGKTWLDDQVRVYIYVSTAFPLSLHFELSLSNAKSLNIF